MNWALTQPSNIPFSNRNPLRVTIAFKKSWHLCVIDWRDIPLSSSFPMRGFWSEMKGKREEQLSLLMAPYREEIRLIRRGSDNTIRLIMITSLNEQCCTLKSALGYDRWMTIPNSTIWHRGSLQLECDLWIWSPEMHSTWHFIFTPTTDIYCRWNII